MCYFGNHDFPIAILESIAFLIVELENMAFQLLYWKSWLSYSHIGKLCFLIAILEIVYFLKIIFPNTILENMALQCQCRKKLKISKIALEKISLQS